MNADKIRRGWATRSAEYSPGYYAYYGPNEASEQIRRTLDQLVDRDAAILELGCSSGRHLSHLHEHGYQHLHGVDINHDAFDVMAAEYPDLATAGVFYDDAIENIVCGLDNDQFGAVFSVETLQHVHPDEAWIFAELARITENLLLTVECEGPTESGQYDETAVSYDSGGFPLYHRPWKRIFTQLGFAEVATQSLGRDTLRVFQHA